MSRLTHSDIAGNPIVPGCYVLYAASWGRSPTLRYGVVTRLAQREDQWDGETGQRATVATIRAIAADRGWSRKDGVYWHLIKDGGETTLGFVDRMLVVPASQVPQEVRDLLDPAYSHYSSVNST